MIVAIAAVHIVVAEASADRISATAAVDHIGVFGGRALIRSEFAIDCQLVICIPPDPVRAASPYQDVAPRTSGDTVPASRADYDVIARLAQHSSTPCIHAFIIRVRQCIFDIALIHAFIICVRQCIFDIALCRREYPVVARAARHVI